ncbi:GntR family transcriptional regulator [Nonomuraea sp. NPDC050328]|uniref:GntR family transcriptional regulator n=1 Tax=Nonomuraea sp. NPDC050328 TaxID=3364361 RepID=UPI0037BA9EA8
MFIYDPRFPRWLQIVDEIKQRIETGEYTPDTKLSEVSLEAEFDVSRPTIRKAMERLRDEGWVVTSQGVGSFPTTADERKRRASGER